MHLFGLLNADKPAGWSSRDLVSFVQRRVRPAKVGHAGTLDPLATGVLVVCIGPATRLVESIHRMPKRYRASFLLGHQSATEDIEGQITLLDRPPRPSPTEIETAIQGFLGWIDQIPPRYSAVQTGGRRAYQLAREGKPVDLQPRPVRIDSIALVQYDYPRMVLDIRCGGGTYIRALGRDIAKSLGTMAVMDALRRLAVGPFRDTDALPPDRLGTGERLADQLRSPIEAVSELPRRSISDAESHLLSQGRPIEPTEPARGPANRSGPISPIREWAAIDGNDQLHAILVQREDGQLWPKRYFLSGRGP